VGGGPGGATGRQDVGVWHGGSGPVPGGIWPPQSPPPRLSTASPSGRADPAHTPGLPYRWQAPFVREALQRGCRDQASTSRWAVTGSVPATVRPLFLARGR
jgi:hypothetical protein